MAGKGENDGRNPGGDNSRAVYRFFCRQCGQKCRVKIYAKMAESAERIVKIGDREKKFLSELCSLRDGDFHSILSRARSGFFKKLKKFSKIDSSSEIRLSRIEYQEDVEHISVKYIFRDNISGDKIFCAERQKLDIDNDS